MPEPPATRSARPFVPEPPTLPRRPSALLRVPDPATRERERFVADLRVVAALSAEPRRARR